MSHVYSRPVVTVDDVKRGSLGSAQSPVRVTYFSSNDYKRAAKVGWDWLTYDSSTILISDWSRLWASWTTSSPGCRGWRTGAS